MGDMDNSNVKNQMDQAITHFEDELKKVRTGRASAAILEGVMVEAYGQMMPLNQTATVKVLDAQMLQVTPFDASNIEAISTAISNDETLGLNPADDGTVVRVPIPAMTEERRLDVVKQLKEEAEKAKVSLRGHRQDTLKKIKQQMNDKEISADDYKDEEKKLNDMINDYNSKIDELASVKEADIMKVQCFRMGLSDRSDGSFTFRK